MGTFTLSRAPEAFRATEESLVQVTEETQASCREVYTPKVGDKIEFAPHEGGVRLKGSVVSVTEEAVVLKAGRRQIPVFRNKGVFSEQKVIGAEKNVASKDIDLACV